MVQKSQNRQEVEWEDVESSWPELVVLEEGEEVIAKYLKTRETETDYGPQKFHSMIDADGNRFTLPGGFDIDNKLLSLPAGTQVKITFTGKEIMKNKKGEVLKNKDGSHKEVKVFHVQAPKGTSRKEVDSDLPF